MEQRPGPSFVIVKTILCKSDETSRGGQENCNHEAPWRLVINAYWRVVIVIGHKTIVIEIGMR